MNQESKSGFTSLRFANDHYRSGNLVVPAPLPPVKRNPDTRGRKRGWRPGSRPISKCRAEIGLPGDGDHPAGPAAFSGCASGRTVKIGKVGDIDGKRQNPDPGGQRSQLGRVRHLGDDRPAVAGHCAPEM